MALFRLLHASDLHIALKQERVGLLDVPKAGLRFSEYLPRRSRTTSYSPDLMDGFIEFVYSRGSHFDAVLISGDLATTGKEEDLEQARECIDGDRQGFWHSSPARERLEMSSHRALRGAGRRVLLLPGNHDRYESTFSFFGPGGVAFDTHFGHYWKVGQGVQGWRLLPPREGTQLGLVAADLTLRAGDQWADPFGSYGQGNAYKDVVEALRRHTNELRGLNPDIALLWVVHFPPVYPDIEDVLRLLDEELLVDAAQAEGISHILAGHTHRPKRYTARSRTGSAVEVLCAGTAAQVVAPAGHFIHELDIEAGPKVITSISSRTHRWHEQDQQWILVACPPASAP